MKELLQVIGIIAFIIGLCAYLYHIWSDCLGENTVLTCMKMLS